MSESESDLLSQIIEIKKHYYSLSERHWLNYELFTWVWWVGIVTTIVVPGIWWKLLDKKRTLEITIFGLLVALFTVFLDVIGSELVLWQYNVRVLPFLPLFFPVDFTLLPVFFMLIYQYCGTWKKFLIRTTILVAVFAFIVEPIAVAIRQYTLLQWRYIYSFPIYFLIAVVCRFVTIHLLKVQGGSLSDKPKI